jgi:hypothetical protein
MTIRIERDFPILLAILVSLSAVVSLPQMTSAASGIREAYGEQDLSLRVLREAMLGIIALYAAFEPRFWKTVTSSQVSGVLALVATYALFEVGYALSLGLPPVVPLAGLRVFEYLPIALIGLTIAQSGAGEQVLARFNGYLRYYVLVEGVLALDQALFAPPLYGVSMLGGGRPFGTFVSPNLFGAAMATCTLCFALDNRPLLRRWAYFSAFLAMLSGSRTALLGSLLVIFFGFLSAMRARDRWALILPAPVLAIGALVLASSPQLSGREDADPTEDGRIDLWERVLSESINGPMDLLFGWGLGLGSNTINVIYGFKYFPGQFNSDSLYLFLLNGYGMIGLIAYLTLLLITVHISGHRDKKLIITFIFVAGLPFNMWEYFPQNAMLMFLWGMVLGTARSSRFRTPALSPEMADSPAAFNPLKQDAR